MKPVLYDMSHSTRDRWEIERRSVMLQQKLGEGMYGEVWQGTAHAFSLQYLLRQSYSLVECHILSLNRTV